MNLNDYIRTVENFPNEWIFFKDITPLLSNVEAFKYSIDEFSKLLDWADKIVWLDARWFIFWWALAYKMWIPFIPVRKAWKLPYDTIKVEYELEYWKNTFEIHTDSILKWEKIAIIDDLLATWWSANAAISLVEKLWWEIHSLNFVVDLTFLNWKEKLKWYKINSLIEY